MKNLFENLGKALNPNEAVIISKHGNKISKRTLSIPLHRFTHCFFDTGYNYYYYFNQ